MIKIIMCFFLCFFFSSSCYAGSGKAAVEKQTDIDYEKCINKLYFETDLFYEIVDTQVISRKEINKDKNALKLSNTNSAGDSIFQAEESRNVTKDRAIFDLKMTQPISGNLKNQKTQIEVKNVQGKAKIIVKMEATVDHFFASEKMVNRELKRNVDKVMSKLEESK